jgi:NADH dehydrogenase/putative oxidoreductase
MTDIAASVRSPLRFTRYAPAVEAISEFVGFLELRLAPVLDLILRVWLAQVFFASGIVKTATWDATVWLYTYEHPVPGLSPNAAAVLGTAIELICPIFLVVGLLTRAAAVPLLLTALFLQVTYKPLDIHLYWMVSLGLVFIRGPRALSLDHLVAPHLVGSALPFAASLQRVGRTLTGSVAPLYFVFLRIWLAYACVSPLVARVGAEAATLGFALEAASVLSSAALLVLGLATRIATLPLIVLSGALLAADPDRDELVLRIMLLGILALEGAGLISFDRMIVNGVKRLFPSLSGDAAWLDGAPRILIVGAGFGGVAAALGLCHAWARVTLVDRRNYHLFQPLLYQVATATLSPADIATPVRALLRGQTNCQVIMGRVTSVDTVNKAVTIGDQRVPYDYLVLATGARHSYFGKDEWEPIAPGLKKIDDATAIRGRILSAFERAETTDDFTERQRLLTFVIVGGGPTGVELAGAIAELARYGMAGEFRSVDPATARVILVQSAPRVLPVMPEGLSAKALRSLERLGVDVRLNARVEHVDETGVLINGQRVEARTVLWAAGVIASPAGRWIQARSDNAGRVLVNPDLSVPDLESVFAIGDTAACPDKNGGMLPGLAAVAKQQGWHVAKFIRARIEGRPDPGAFRYRDYGSMATIGRKAAVAALPGVRVSGTVAWWLWGFVHVAFLLDVRSRITVMIDWFWSYLTYARSTRLITGGETAPE